jgi:hypothetical protein
MLYVLFKFLFMLVRILDMRSAFLTTAEVCAELLLIISLLYNRSLELIHLA